MTDGRPLMSAMAKQAMSASQSAFDSFKRISSRDKIQEGQGLAFTAWCNSMLGACRMMGSVNASSTQVEIFQATWFTQQLEIDQNVFRYDPIMGTRMRRCTREYLDNCYTEAASDPSTLAVPHGVKIASELANVTAPILHRHATSLLSLARTVSSLIDESDLAIAELWWVSNATLHGQSSLVSSWLSMAKGVTVLRWHPIGAGASRWVDGTRPFFRFAREILSPSPTPEEGLISQMDSMMNLITTSTRVKEEIANVQSRALDGSRQIRALQGVFTTEWDIPIKAWPAKLLDRASDVLEMSLVPWYLEQLIGTRVILKLQDNLNEVKSAI